HTPPLSLPSFLSPTPPPPHIYTLSLHDALPISQEEHLFVRGLRRDHDADGTRVTVPREVGEAPRRLANLARDGDPGAVGIVVSRSEEHTSELQSRFDLVCRLLLEKKKKILAKTS